MKGRGQIGIQFNWIFVIIAGALILSFFVMIVNRQRDISEKKLAADLLADLDMIITGQAVSPGSSKTLDMAELELSFTCEDYSIKSVPKTSGNSIIFTASRIKGSTLLAWTLEWAMPYRTANFIYLTVPEIKYMFVDPAGADSLGIVSDFPEVMDIEVVSGLPDEFEEYQRLRIILLGAPLDDVLPLPSEGLAAFNDDEVSILYIDGAASQDDFDGDAWLHFYRKKGDSMIRDNKGVFGGKFKAMGKETVYGAIFTDDYELYECNMKKAIRKLEVVTGIYKERANDLLAGLPLGDPCSPYYNDEAFDVILEETGKFFVSGPNIGNIYVKKKQIETMNDRTIFASCPEIY